MFKSWITKLKPQKGENNDFVVLFLLIIWSKIYGEDTLLLKFQKIIKLYSETCTQWSFIDGMQCDKRIFKRRDLI